LALPPLDLSETQSQKSERSQISFTNALHFAAFDKSDEAMLNDYQELMGLLRNGEPVALDSATSYCLFYRRSRSVSKA
jgi:hypothetical protein